MEDVFLGRLSLFVSVIPLSKLYVLERENWPTKMPEGKEQKFRGFPEAFRSFKYFMATAREMAMCNDINCN